LLNLYIVDSNWSESAVAAAYDALLPQEQQRVDRMCASGKAQLTVSLFVRRPLLAQATGLTDLGFRRDQKGKLSLEADPGWCFNVADTSGCVVLAVARDQAVGVDVENTDRVIANLDDFISACLSLQEQEKAMSLDVEAKKRWVLQAWVLKEAYTKRLGEGLSFGFDRITVDPDAEPPLLAIDGKDLLCSDYLAHWSGYLDHYIGVSVEGVVDEVRIKLLNEADFKI